MIAASLFSGIGAPECAMPHWNWAWCAEIERFPCAVLNARHPDSINLGDVTAHDFTERAAAIAKPDVLVFGSPCQSFSVAGRRLGLDDPRGNLALVALGIVGRLKPRWFVFENVPGLLSSDKGRDWSIFLRTVDELGYSGAWASLDAQHFGVAQRRERLFFVGHSGDWRRAAAVLFEPESLCGNHPPRRETGQGVAPTISARTEGGGGLGTDFDCDGGLIANSVTAKPYQDIGENANLVTHSLRADGFDASEDGTGRETPLIAFDPTAGRDMRAYADGSTPGLKVGTGLDIGWAPAIAFSSKDHGADAMDDLAPTLRAGTHDKSHANAGVPPAIAFDTTQITSRANRSVPKEGDPCHPIPAHGHAPAIAGSVVRRLTVRECERLMGLPDDYTLVDYRGKPAADGPRYKALGNSMAVPVVRWILERIEKA